MTPERVRRILLRYIGAEAGHHLSDWQIAQQASPLLGAGKRSIMRWLADESREVVGSAVPQLELLELLYQRDPVMAKSLAREMIAHRREEPDA